MDEPEHSPMPPTQHADEPADTLAAGRPSPSAGGARVAEGDIRASDADRDRVADILREALAEGRLDAGEHAERIDRVYRAKTVGELEPLVRDLPISGTRAARARAADEAPHSASRPSAAPAENLVAVFSASTRKGR